MGAEHKRSQIANPNNPNNNNNNNNNNGPPPFLTKTYEMVDDPHTDHIVSWSDNNNSFVVWNVSHFSQDLLPQYFKHNNFSSFVRQLNTYGFHKTDPDRWEFANDGFIKGKKESLKHIHRRKPHPSQLQKDSNVSSSTSCNDPTHVDLEEQIQRLKHDKILMVSELLNLRQQQRATEMDLEILGQYLEALEDKHKKVIRFFAQVMQNPGSFMDLIVQQYQNDNNLNNSDNNLVSPRQLRFNANKRIRSIDDINHDDYHQEVIKVARVDNHNIYMDSSCTHDDIDTNISVVDVDSTSTHDVVDTSVDDTIHMENLMLKSLDNTRCTSLFEGNLVNLQVSDSVLDLDEGQNDDDDDDDGDKSPQSQGSGVTGTQWEHGPIPRILPSELTNSSIARDCSSSEEYSCQVYDGANNFKGHDDNDTNNNTSILRTYASNDNFWENLLTENPHIVDERDKRWLL